FNTVKSGTGKLFMPHYTTSTREIIGVAYEMGSDLSMLSRNNSCPDVNCGQPQGNTSPIATFSSVIF
ncbi:MAG: hypothetical protein ACRC64_00780, partial [Plesiomonas shigelloides]